MGERASTKKSGEDVSSHLLGFSAPVGTPGRLQRSLGKISSTSRPQSAPQASTKKSGEEVSTHLLGFSASRPQSAPQASTKKEGEGRHDWIHLPRGNPCGGPAEALHPHAQPFQPFGGVEGGSRVGSVTLSFHTSRNRDCDIWL